MVGKWNFGIESDGKAGRLNRGILICGNIKRILGMLILGSLKRGNIMMPPFLEQPLEWLFQL
jgi:hypothetical protein